MPRQIGGGIRGIVWLTGALVVGTGGAHAQSERAEWAELSRLNQAGLREFCSREGHLPDPVPAPGLRETGTPADVAAYAAGRAGVIQYATKQATLAEDAAASGTTIAYRCRLLAISTEPTP